LGLRCTTGRHGESHAVSGDRCGEKVQARKKKHRVGGFWGGGGEKEGENRKIVKILLVLKGVGRSRVLIVVRGMDGTKDNG